MMHPHNRHHERAIVEGLENGANDYVTKPFRRSELMARIRMHLRSTSRATPAPLPPPPPPLLPAAGGGAGGDDGGAAVFGGGGLSEEQRLLLRREQPVPLLAIQVRWQALLQVSRPCTHLWACWLSC
jgi:DNA-binding response OmpR family regulator